MTAYNVLLKIALSEALCEEQSRFPALYIVYSIFRH